MLLKYINLNWIVHLGIGLVIRFVLIAYGVYHDQISTLPYTDIDYKVFTDASRHILNGNSPYDRYTYRYSPLVAIFLVPNVLLHHSFGKILFSLFDLIDALLIRAIVKDSLKEYQSYREKYAKKNDLTKTYHLAISGKKRENLKRSNSNNTEQNDVDYMSNISMIIWLYNPLTLAIGTRGNCDSLAVFFVLTTLYFLENKKQYFLAGLFHGISIHFRLYPILYSLSLFMYLSQFSFYSTEDRRKSYPTLRQIQGGSEKSVQTSGDAVVKCTNEKKTIFKKKYLLYLIPNLNQIKLVFGCFLSLFSLIGLFYYLYGYTFLYETYIYHFLRKDTKHNFSLYFYLQYLTAWIKNIGLWQKVLIVLPQIVLLLVFSIRYGLNRFSLNFCILTQTIVMVTYNTVLTSQYFIWIMAILPLCVWQIQMSLKKALFLLAIWFAAQGAWLLPAYFLEFHGQNTFLFIWIQSVSLFCAHIAILGRLILNFMPIPDKEYV